jgi:hypothetical protein
VSADTVRTHVVLPREIIRTIDDLVGRRARSRFLTEAAAEKLRRLRQQEALRKMAGALRHVDIPGWETPEAASEWVAKGRAEDDQRLEELLRDR